jgi:hypothetical protein
MIAAFPEGVRCPRSTSTAEIERLRAAGVAFRGDLVTGPGGSQATIEDPSGNPVELFAPAR